VRQIAADDRLRNPAPADDEEIEEGRRHEALFRWALSALTSQGLVGQPALDAMLGHNARCIRPPLPPSEVERLWRWVDKSRIAATERELAAIAERALAGAEAATSNGPFRRADGDAGDETESETPRPSKLRVLDTFGLATNAPKPVDWLAEGVLARGKLAMPGGREKRGKSLLVLACAVCAASGGGEVAGIRVKAGRWLIVDGENGENEIHRRLRALGLAPAHAENLILVEARGFNLSTDLGGFEDLLDRYRPDAAVLDSFRACWRGDERDDAEVAATLDPLRDLAHDGGIGTGLVHQARKNGDEYRGSTAIGACVEWVAMLSREPGDPDKTRRRLTTPLARFAPERDDRWLSIRSDGDEGPISIVAAEPYVPQHETPVRSELAGEMREWVLAQVARCKGDYQDSQEHMFAPSWTGSDLCRALEREPEDKTARRAIRQLEGEGFLVQGTDKRWRRASDGDGWTKEAADRFADRVQQQFPGTEERPPADAP
jgi:AAA domain